MRISFKSIGLIVAFAFVPSLLCAQSWWDILLATQAAVKVYQAATVSDEDLANYMSQTMRVMDTENRVLPASSDYDKRLRRVTKGFTDAQGISLNFKVYNDAKTINAFASPDGSVRVYSGLMDLMNDEELRGIIGHEIGHLAERHSLKQLRTSLLASAARDGLMLTDGRLATLAASQIGDLSEVLLNCHYSRVQETAADEYGYRFLKRTGYSPMAMIYALRKLESMKSQSNRYARYALTLFSTHPDIHNRIEHLCQMARKEGLYVSETR